mmetsp:Transcript_20885/g.31178  ORF Transcript_20885/g.31178 Transcript_20885/m.31178 type:complete len:106 (-) Transcript_20885:82-399(-)
MGRRKKENIVENTLKKTNERIAESLGNSKVDDAFRMLTGEKKKKRNEHSKKSSENITAGAMEIENTFRDTTEKMKKAKGGKKKRKRPKDKDSEKKKKKKKKKSTQ